MGKYHYESNEAIKEAYGKTLFGEIIPFYLEKLDDQAKKNGGYLVGGKVNFPCYFNFQYANWKFLISS